MVIIYNSKLVRIIIPTFKMILICFVLLCKKDKTYYTTEDIEHERCHSKQWFALFCISLPILFLIGMFSSYWWLLLSIVTFYLWYGIEWLVRFILLSIKEIKATNLRSYIKNIGNISHEAYRMIAFEQEAREVETGVAECHYISFLHYYK